MVNELVELFYPSVCVVCGSVLPAMRENAFACCHCRKQTPYVKPPVCKYCGKHIDTGSECADCSLKAYAFQEGYAVFSYELVQKSLHHFKYGGCKKDGQGMARFMFSFMEAHYPGVLKSYDLLLPVPIHKKRRRTRGFNQSEILSGALSELCGVPSMGQLLVRTRNTTAQAKLQSLEKRKENMKDAFALTDVGAVNGLKILLIDDIFTTGSTLQECAKLLSLYGAEKVDCLTYAIADNMALS